MKGVLEGIRVLDCSRVIAGPYCTFLLATMGAEVIRVERPGGEMDWDLGPPIPERKGRACHPLYTGCNKDGITLDLRKKEGQKIFSELVSQSDVVVHNYSFRAAQSMGLSYENLERINPGLILLAISGFGQTGPYRERNCWDPNAQAMAGIMSLGGGPESSPTRMPFPVIDFSAGCYGALGILHALRHRDKTGEGQMVDIALFDVAVSIVGVTAMEMKRAGQTRTKVGNATYWTIANSFQAKDGWVFLSLATNSIWKRFWRAIDKEEILRDQRFADDYQRFVNREEIMMVLQKWASEKTVGEIMEVTEDHHIPCSPINPIQTWLSDPQVREREMLVDLDCGEDFGIMPIPGLVTKLSKSPGHIVSPVPLPGQDNKEVYGKLLGYSAEDLTRLMREKII